MVGAAKTSDRRVLRTQRLLHEALLSLLLERGWDEVSIQDICQRADVGRSTFYVHFADKEELLLSGFEPFKKELRRHVKAAGDEPLAFLRPLVEHVRDHHRLLRALAGKRSAQAVQKRLLSVIAELLEDDFGALAPPGARGTAAVRYAAGALLEVLLWWLESRPRLDVDELEAVLRQLTTSVRAELKRWR